MMTSASTSSFSKTESSPSLSEVVTRVWPWDSIHFLIPSSFSVVPRSSGCCSAWIPPYKCDVSHTRPFVADITVPLEANWGQLTS